MSKNKNARMRLKFVVVVGRTGEKVLPFTEMKTTRAATGLWWGAWWVDRQWESGIFALNI